MRNLWRRHHHGNAVNQLPTLLVRTRAEKVQEIPHVHERPVAGKRDRHMPILVPVLALHAGVEGNHTTTRYGEPRPSHRSDVGGGRASDGGGGHSSAVFALRASAGKRARSSGSTVVNSSRRRNAGGLSTMRMPRTAGV